MPSTEPPSVTSKVPLVIASSFPSVSTSTSAGSRSALSSPPQAARPMATAIVARNVSSDLITKRGNLADPPPQPEHREEERAEDRLEAQDHQRQADEREAFLLQGTQAAVDPDREDDRRDD